MTENDHVDIPHVDLGHGDEVHDDGAHTDLHEDSAHNDWFHLDIGHFDFDHMDDGHQDTPHFDSHSDFHNDFGHQDFGHSDFGHSDFGHGDAGHFDNLHVDHVDAAHVDFHFDLGPIGPAEGPVTQLERQTRPDIAAVLEEMFQFLARLENNQIVREERVTKLVAERSAEMAKETMKAFQSIGKGVAMLEERLRELEKRMEKFDS